MNTLEHRITLTDVTSANVQIDVVMAYMKSNDFQVADVVFASAKELSFRYAIYSRGQQEKRTQLLLSNEI